MSIPEKLGDPTRHSRCQALIIVHMMLTRSFQDYYVNDLHGFWQLLLCLCFGVGVSVQDASPSKRYVTTTAHRRHTDDHMVVYTWDSRACHDRCDLGRVVQRDDGPHQCIKNGARRLRGSRTLTIVSVVVPADIWHD